MNGHTFILCLQKSIIRDSLTRNDYLIPELESWLKFRCIGNWRWEIVAKQWQNPNGLGFAMWSDVHLYFANNSDAILFKLSHSQYMADNKNLEQNARYLPMKAIK